MKSKEKDIEQIIEGCKSGNRSCQKLFFERFYGRMMIVVMRYIKDKDSAQDVLSDAFIKVFNKISQFNSEGNVEGWIRRIVVNTTIDSLRRNKTFLMDLDTEENIKSEEEDIHIEGMENSDISQEEYLNMIQDLPPRYRAVFNMRLFEGMSHKEISEKLDIVEGTSKSNYSKARVLLQTAVIELIDKNKKKEENKKELCREMDIEQSRV